MNRLNRLLLLIVVLCLLVLIAAAPLFAQGKKTPPVAKYAVSTRKGIHPIAPHAGDRAWEGLERAAVNSPAIIPLTGDKLPSDEIKPGKK